MGPRRKASENTAICEPVCTAPDGFNGAEAQSLGKSGGTPINSYTLEMLQWGRGAKPRKIAEQQFVRLAGALLQWGRGAKPRKIPPRPLAISRRRSASMGPRRKASENSTARGLYTKRSTLQWGRGAKPRKIARAVASGSASPGFNGAEAQSLGKSARVPHARRTARRFNGAEAQSLGKSARVPHARRTARRFNGAEAQSLGKSTPATKRQARQGRFNGAEAQSLGK